MVRICALAHLTEMDDDRLTLLTQLLSDPTRRNALALLRTGEELCVCELMASLGATQSRMSRHMGALKEAGLVTDRRDAQWVRYRIATGMDAERAARAVAIFRTHDVGLLDLQYAVRQDEQQFIQTTAQAAAQLQELFEADLREAARDRK